MLTSYVISRRVQLMYIELSIMLKHYNCTILCDHDHKPHNKMVGDKELSTRGVSRDLTH